MFIQLMELSKKRQSQRDTVMDIIFRDALENHHKELLSYLASLKV